MVARTLPGIGLKAFWDLGFNGWKDENDLNLLILSVVAGGQVLSKVATLPATPTDGDVHLLDETAGADANKLCIRDAGAWVMVTPLEGAILYDLGATTHRTFDGTAWVALATGAGGGGTGDMLAANNLSDLANIATARDNLGVYSDAEVDAAIAALRKRVVNLAIVNSALLSGEVLAAITPPSGETWTFPANFSGASGRKLSGGTNPAASYSLDVKKNGTSVGTITISTAGAVTFATTGGTSFTLAGGTDELQVVGPATADTALGYAIAIPVSY